MRMNKKKKMKSKNDKMYGPSLCVFVAVFVVVVAVVVAV